jgi:regulator of sirC expression with transglutaminase-like and TPR domain
VPRDAPIETAAPPTDVVGAVQAILAPPDAQLDYAEAKLAVDRLVDPGIDTARVAAELDALAQHALSLSGRSPDDGAKIEALRRLIYRSGPWNGWRPFGYDHSNVRGADVRVKLISHYLDTRLGDCVSMPVLFLILADKLGLEVALAQAPNHLFVRHTDRGGLVTNFETTSGANPARDEWIRQVRPMTDRAIESRLYMRTLSRREGVAVMATTVLQHLMDSGRYEQAIGVGETILSHHPNDGLVLANIGNACFHLLKREFLDSYPAPSLIPLHLRPRYRSLRERNLAAFSAAGALGWESDADPSR